MSVDFGFPESLLGEAADFIKSRDEWPAASHGNQPVLYHGVRLQDAWQYNRAVREIAVYPTVLEFLEAIYGKEPLPFQTLNFPIGTEQPAHSDTVHFNCWPNDGSMCGVWVALEDVDDENGPLIYYPGSHKLPELFSLNFNCSDYKDYEIKLAQFIKSIKLQPRLATLKRGEAVVWAANLLHGGGSVKDLKRTRLSQVTHYAFKGSEFHWRPRLSNLMTGQIVRFTPQFIQKSKAPSSTASGKLNRLAQYQFRKRGSGPYPGPLKTFFRKFCPPFLLQIARRLRAR